ncbi:MAG: acetylxylan esterase [Lentisphaeria bacterium]|nr:acetylxylan esterase [Lentisphaeria bacterium]
MIRFFTIFLLMMQIFFCHADDDLYLSVKTSKDPLSYRCNEEIVFTVSVKNGTLPEEGIPYIWFLYDEDNQTQEGKGIFRKDLVLQVTGKLFKPGFLYLKVHPLDKDGKPRKGMSPLSASAGAEVDKIRQTVSEPADYDEFWTKQKNLADNFKEKMRLIPVKSKYKNVKSWYFEISAPGPAPATGFVSMPENAKPRSLKACMTFHSYGFEPIDKCDELASKGYISMSVSRFGLPQGKNEKFYDFMKLTELKNFGFRNNEKPENSDFNYMMLRNLRALEYLKKYPEWNRKDLEMRGVSMGGMQAILLASLEPAVSAVHVSVPWCVNIGGIQEARFPGHRPKYVRGLDYFDAVNAAKRLKCPVTLFVGLGDRICPASGMFALYNAMTCPKKLVYQQTAGHRTPAPDTKELVYKPVQKE